MTNVAFLPMNGDNYDYYISCQEAPLSVPVSEKEKKLNEKKLQLFN
jgi:hypothetical protein